MNDFSKIVYGVIFMNTDLRVIKTENNIEQTFFKLLKELPFEKITIQKILKAALISKGTFYAHYLDKYDLAEKIVQKFLKQFKEDLLFRKNGIEHKESYQKLYKMFLNSINDTTEHFYILSKLHLENINFEDEIKKILSEVFLSYVTENNITLSQQRLQAEIMTGICIMYMKNPDHDNLDFYKFLSSAKELLNIIPV